MGLSTPRRFLAASLVWVVKLLVLGKSRLLVGWVPPEGRPVHPRQHLACVVVGRVHVMHWVDAVALDALQGHLGEIFIYQNC